MQNKTTCFYSKWLLHCRLMKANKANEAILEIINFSASSAPSTAVGIVVSAVKKRLQKFFN